MAYPNSAREIHSKLRERKERRERRQKRAALKLLEQEKLAWTTESPSPVLYTTSEGITSVLPPIMAKVSVGPVMSLIGGKDGGVHHITIHMSIQEIKDLRIPQFQQLQLDSS